jgi:hypothetical protein
MLIFTKTKNARLPDSVHRFIMPDPRAGPLDAGRRAGVPK